MSIPLIQISNLEKVFTKDTGLINRIRFRKGQFHRRQESVYALNGVNLTILKGETLCVVGETGCGKSTLARTLMGLTPPSAGEIHYLNERIDHLNDKERLLYRRRMQMVFQNPYGSLNPRMTVYQTLREAISFHNPQMKTREIEEKIEELLESVGLHADAVDRYPHEFSGGQRQRISLARALSVEPEFIVADEPLAALDVSVQAQVLNLMMDKQEEYNLTYLFITHDLAVVEHFATRVAVMYLGRVCELASRESLFSSPKHPYTRALLSAIPRLDTNAPELIKLSGEVPTPMEKPIGCVFQARCPHATPRCFAESPAMKVQKDGSSVACHALEEGRIL
ncbi:ABC transporter ATP-binding protein [Marinomonas mediterranea]|jgi:oligopeptide/dipeptide ABC transporter, ATP-binding protein, C-terminal domain|uniref:Oligopeptide/dipeptide ABC transporter, ATPase subunit n=1 Tax=Marinomonas mediterranea (strain ATCC 700492 / JCM 21426 / NBRC 103028 / MMB-1) TaxID=717774 RepID=F2JZX6_MARM1|nr:oligopeptide/dipeptide ABC transporter ATP-binding protein [Marinomonas mediterranea]ADZ92088.1 oligopeptide/dipeptide ABC transporter, ATPase subunit [Marinomonas mediterranea MMB-1]WCN10050.1 ATP-binding cassette domain-containing protein [Marinomonas mediterranea]WCN14100.1 ATP-binding cassette domain-containing protein [Marinomonas mediterranea]WCN18156.1 ATP-binding cassette domain-containing protein [Marinomonas mediterranea MMB-1]